MKTKAGLMHLPEKYRSLRVHAIIWILLPLAIMVFGLIGVGIYSYQRIVVQLLTDHQRQLATVTATHVSEVLDGYTLVLEALAGNPDIYSDSPELRQALLDEAARSLEIFNAGVILVDPAGNYLAGAPGGIQSPILDFAQQETFLAAWSKHLPAISNAEHVSNGSGTVILITAPIYDPLDRFRGALLGAVDLIDSKLSEPVRHLVVGEGGLAYLVDGQGQVIYHPETSLIGINQGELSFVQKVTSGENGGLLWQDPSGKYVLNGYAPVSTAGWGLIVQEPWDSVNAPARSYGMMMVAAGLLAFIPVVLLAWGGVRRILIPVQALSAQARKLASLDGVEPVAESGISEIDSLEHTFDQMARQIASYRLGLRRYVGAITQKQEDERRHIARELHDETVQSLLAISRRLELEQASEKDPLRAGHLAEIQSQIGDTLAGVRQISRDLRPLVLEDLGLLPALQALARGARQGPGAVPQVKLEIPEEPVHLPPQQELALYRITQEALTNARKHAHPTGVRVSLEISDTEILLGIADDGEGFEVPDSLADLAQKGCFGLMGIQERVWAMGGRLSIQSTRGEGTHLQVCMPVITETT
jgi:signal transduction histidine kinase